MEKQILLSFDDEKIKQIAEIFGNKTCKKILEILTEYELTETEISQKLKIPLNTVDYNIKKLVQSGLIEKSSHWWSVKGKKMPVYKVSNKKIIISPKKISTSLKTLVPSILITGLAGLLVRQILKPEQTFSRTKETSALAAGTAKSAVDNFVSQPQTFLQYISSFPIWAWFLIGAGFFLIIFLIIKKISNK